MHLLDKAEVCRLFGGNKPLNPSTLYRGIKLGRYPKPVKIGGNLQGNETEQPSSGYWIGLWRR